jgi:hypothetical protein
MAPAASLECRTGWPWHGGVGMQAEQWIQCSAASFESEGCIGCMQCCVMGHISASGVWAGN